MGEFKKRNKEQALEELKQLVALFNKNEAQYKSSAYDEANTRTDFIDKFFELLNWDVRNEAGKSEQYRNVVREDKVKVGRETKAPDYAFRIGGQRLFFVEAKKPSVNIKEATDPAFQIKRYAYSAKLPLSILTDFEEFAIYSTNNKPKEGEKAGVGRIFFCTYDEYEKYFDFFWETFTPDGIEQGAFDKYCTAETDVNRRGTSQIDNDLLAVIEGWRVELARNIALRNGELSLVNLNMAVQKIIDRLIFLRIAEDKEIEEPNGLKAIATATNVYEEVSKEFERADKKYNSGLFHSDDWIKKITIDDNILKDIIMSMYAPKCPYAWEILPIEVLGDIYENFLGSEITFRGVAGGRHTARVEQKPGVQKGVGAYYTPKYIVDYIVQQTVGKKLEGKTPETVGTLTICDPACGSGSFLVGVYRYLLEWYFRQYTKDDKAIKKYEKAELIIRTTRGLTLTLAEKKRILVAHIYGVDIDSQAVEVAKLSLFLQMLDGEGKQLQGNSATLFRESNMGGKVLPDLGSNIKCGNSLIGSQFYDGQDLSLFDDDSMRKINAFDWDKEFPEVFANNVDFCNANKIMTDRPTRTSLEALTA